MTPIEEAVWCDWPVCGPCADEYYAEWPEGHRASTPAGKCALCGSGERTFAASDYNWPRLGKKYQDAAELMREV